MYEMGGQNPAPVRVFAENKFLLPLVFLSSSEHTVHIRF